MKDVSLGISSNERSCVGCVIYTSESSGRLRGCANEGKRPSLAGLDIVVRSAEGGPVALIDATSSAIGRDYEDEGGRQKRKNEICRSSKTD